jgi:hypothetical protein
MAANIVNYGRRRLVGQIIKLHVSQLILTGRRHPLGWRCADESDHLGRRRRGPFEVRAPVERPH